MELNIDQIESILPHRYPFLLVDKIVECTPGEGAKGVKCVTANEPFFQGHFPGFKVMPGVLIIEALAQVGAVAILTEAGSEGRCLGGRSALSSYHAMGGKSSETCKWNRQYRKIAGQPPPPVCREGVRAQ